MRIFTREERQYGMKQARIDMYRKLSFKEYILAIKYFLSNNKLEFFNGICHKEFMNESLSEEDLSDLFRKALKHKTFVKFNDEVHINPSIYTFLNAWSNSKNIIILNKPSYEDKKIISFAKIEDYYLATLQNSKKDEVILFVDQSIEKILELLQPELIAKDLNKEFKNKDVNMKLASDHISSSFSVKHTCQLAFSTIDNTSCCKLDQDVLFHVGKSEFELVSGDLKTTAIIKKRIEELQLEILKYIVENSPNPDRDEAEKKSEKVFEDDEIYTTLSYDKLIRIEGFPLTRKDFIKQQIACLAKSFADKKRLIKIIGINLIVSALVLIWNMYGMCYLNDTFRLSDSSFWGSATAYLFGGSLSSRSDVKGFGTFDLFSNTLVVASSFYFLLSIAGRNLFTDLVNGTFIRNIKSLFVFPKKFRLYSNKSVRQVNTCIWVGVIISALMAFLIFNPFTVILLALMLLFSVTKCESGKIAPFIMVYKTSSGYTKISQGLKRKPYFADIQLWIFSMGVGLSIYSIVNLIVWLVFAYHIWARIIFTVLLIILAFFRLGIIKISKSTSKTISAIVLICITAILVALSQKGVILADDGGWSESGGTLAGLLQNSGIGTILGFSAVLGVAAFVGLSTFGLGLPLVIGGAALAAGGSGIWAATTDTGRKTAFDFIHGQYSPYGGNSKIASGLNFAVGLVPGVGQVWGTYSGVRDTSAYVKNGDYVQGAFEAGFTLLGLKGIAHGIADAGNALAHTGAKFMTAKMVKQQVRNTLNSTEFLESIPAEWADTWRRTGGTKIGQFTIEQITAIVANKQIYGSATKEIRNNAFGAEAIIEAIEDEIKKQAVDPLLKKTEDAIKETLTEDKIDEI